MKYFLLVVTILINLICIISGGFLFYQWLTIAIGIEGFLLKPIFIVSSIIAIVVPVRIKFSGEPKYSLGFPIWTLAMIFTFTTLLSYNYLRNRSDVLLHAKFYWESGIDLYLRENGSYKAINEDWMSGYVSYGQYKIEGDSIITNKNLDFGTVEMLETLVLTSDSLNIHFQLDQKWKGIIEGELSIQTDYLFEREPQVD